MESWGCTVPPQRIAQNNGCFNDLQRLSFASVADGLGNTLLAAEQANNLGEHTQYGWWVSGNLGDTLFTTFFPPNLKDSGGSNLPHRSATSSYHPAGINALMCDGSTRFITNSIDSWTFDFRRLRPAGCTIASGGWWDNLPRAGVWQGLATRAGGEVISSPEF